MKRSNWEVGAGQGSPWKEGGLQVSILQLSTDEWIEHHDGQIHKNPLLTNNPEVCDNLKLNLEVWKSSPVLRSHERWTSGWHCDFWS